MVTDSCLMWALFFQSKLNTLLLRNEIFELKVKKKKKVFNPPAIVEDQVVILAALRRLPCSSNSKIPSWRSTMFRFQTSSLGCSKEISRGLC